MRIGLISDVHACASPLQEALALFKDEGVDQVICLGDTAGYGIELDQCVDLLGAAGCLTLAGNHDIWTLRKYQDRLRGSSAEFLAALVPCWEKRVSGLRVLAVHAVPPGSVSRGITLLDREGIILPERVLEWSRELSRYNLDVLLVGHTHQVFAENLGGTMVINPGSTVYNHSCGVLCLPERTVRFYPLSGKRVRRVWHWGMMTGADSG